MVILEVDVVVCVPDDWSLRAQFGSDLELNSVFHWVWWVFNSLQVDLPSLVKAIAALPPVDMSVLRIGSSMDIKASDSQISDVSSASIEPSDLLDVVGSEVGNDGSITIVVPGGTSVVVLDGDCLSSVSSCSNRSCSPVNNPPLLNVFSHSVSDSQSELMSTDVFMVEEGLSSLHHRSDLELDSISQWVSWEVNSLSVNEPLLRCVVPAWVELSVFIDAVTSTSSSEANAGMVDNSSSSEGNLLEWFVSPWSNVGIVSWSMLVSISVRDGIVSLLPPSDGVSS